MRSPAIRDADGHIHVTVEIDGTLERWVLTANDRERLRNRAFRRPSPAGVMPRYPRVAAFIGRVAHRFSWLIL